MLKIETLALITCCGNKLLRTALRIGGAEYLGDVGEVGCDELSEAPLPGTTPWSCDRSCDGSLSMGDAPQFRVIPHLPQDLER